MGNDCKSNFITLNRKLLDWEWTENPFMVALWVKLLLLANFQDTTWQGIPVKRGQLITGRHSLAKKTGISEQSLRTCLERLKSTNEITIKSTSRYSIITIIKYDSYQAKDKALTSELTSELTNHQPAINQQSTTSNNDNNDNNDNKNNKQGSSVPELPARPIVDPIEILISQVEIPPTIPKPHLIEWLRYKKEKGQAYKPAGLKALLKAWASKPEVFSKAVQHSMENNYQGLFEPKEDLGRRNNKQSIQDQNFALLERICAEEALKNG